jgi:hypothetical protein
VLDIPARRICVFPVGRWLCSACGEGWLLTAVTAPAFSLSSAALLSGKRQTQGSHPALCDLVSPCVAVRCLRWVLQPMTLSYTAARIDGVAVSGLDRFCSPPVLCAHHSLAGKLAVIGTRGMLCGFVRSLYDSLQGLFVFVPHTLAGFRGLDARGVPKPCHVHLTAPTHC